MPRILRNYLISFAVIGMILIIVNWIDHYLTSNEIPPVSENQSQELTQREIRLQSPASLTLRFPTNTLL